MVLGYLLQDRNSNPFLSFTFSLQIKNNRLIDSNLDHFVEKNIQKKRETVLISLFFTSVI